MNPRFGPLLALLLVLAFHSRLFSQSDTIVYTDCPCFTQKYTNVTVNGQSGDTIRLHLGDYLQMSFSFAWDMPSTSTCISTYWASSPISAVVGFNWGDNSDFASCIYVGTIEAGNYSGFGRYGINSAGPSKAGYYYLNPGYYSGLLQYGASTSSNAEHVSPLKMSSTLTVIWVQDTAQSVSEVTGAGEGGTECCNWQAYEANVYLETGRVGIGTLDPLASLDVAGEIAISGQVVIDENKNWVGNAVPVYAYVDAPLTGVGTSHSPIQISQSGATVNQVLKWNGSAWSPGDDLSGSYIIGYGLVSNGDTLEAEAYYPLWNASKLQSISIGTVPPLTGQFLGYNGNAWVPTNAPTGTNYTAGEGIRITGDVIATLNGDAIWNANSLQNTAVSTSSPAEGQVLTFHESKWMPSDIPPASPYYYVGGTGISIMDNVISAANTACIWNANMIQHAPISTFYPSEGQVLQYLNNAWTPGDLPASTDYVEGTGIDITDSLIAAENNANIWNASRIQDRTVSSVYPGEGQVLQFNNGMWTPSNPPAGSDYVAGDGIRILGDTISAQNNAMIWNANRLQGTIVASSSPREGQVLKFSQTMWVPSDDIEGSAYYVAGTGIEISDSLISAKNGANIWNAGHIQSKPVSNTTPAEGQVLQYNNGTWTPSTAPASAYYVAGTGIEITDSLISAKNGANIWNAGHIQSKPVSNTTPAEGQVLQYSNGTWTPSTAPTSAYYVAGTGIEITDSLISTKNGANIWNAGHIQSKPISDSPPAEGQVLQYNNGTWTPSTVSGGSPSGWEVVTQQGQSNILSTENGAVGIGTDNPTEKLDVAGAIAIRGRVVINDTGAWVGPLPIDSATVLMMDSLESQQEQMDTLMAQMTDAMDVLNDGMAQIQSGMDQIQMGDSLLRVATTPSDSSEAQDMIDDGTAALQDGEETIEDGQADVLAIQDDIAAVASIMAAGVSAISAAVSVASAAIAAVAAAEATAAAAESTIAAAEATAAAAESTVAAAEATLAAAEASLAALEATGAAFDASLDALAASGSAGDALTSAGDAEVSAGDANTSAGAASDYADDASVSADSAANSASAAAESAQAAEDAMNTPLGGDLSGRVPNAQVTGIRGKSVSNTTPAEGQVLKFHNNQWVPATMTASSTQPDTIQGWRIDTVAGNAVMYSTVDGPIGIGTETPSAAYKLSVNGFVRAKKVVVESGWADHVFEPDYPLLPLDSLQSYISVHGHLPGVQSAAKIAEDGLDVGEAQAQMMAKIEELTLYLLQMKAENDALRQELNQIKTQLED